MTTPKPLDLDAPGTETAATTPFPVTPPSVPRSLAVALVSEGAYPFHPGGVSVWCDQLVQGMPEHSFTAAALTIDGAERNAWPMPANLSRVVNIPLWGPRRRRRGRHRNPPKWFVEAHESFLHVLIRPPKASARHGPASTEAFLSALRGMFEYAQEGDLGAALVSNDALGRLMDVWQDAGMDTDEVLSGVGALTLHDALTAADLIEHMLRPLSHPPIRTDVCHMAMNGLSTLVGMAAKWTYGTRLVMSEHGVYLRERYLGMVNEPARHAVKVLLLSFFRALASAAYRVVDVLAPHSSYNRRWQLYNGAEPARMRTMYNGIDPADFPTAEGEPEVPTIVFVGRIDPLKDLHTLIRAFAIVRAQVPDARLRMFGPVTAANESYYASCLALAEELGLSGAAVFEGRVPKQVDAYHAGHLVALTSVSEGFPYTVVESMATGRPQVCTNVGGVSEAVGDAGFVVCPRDHEAVAQACVRLLTDAGLRHRLGQAARQRVLNNFTLQQWNDAYRQIYHELVPDPAGSQGTAPCSPGERGTR